MKTRTVLVSTIASFAIFASTAVASSNAQPLSHLFHLHPKVSALQDDRISVRLYNDRGNFKEVMVNGQSYTVLSHQVLHITAPVGTPVYVGANVPLHHRGDVLFTVAPEMQNQQIALR